MCPRTHKHASMHMHILPALATGMLPVQERAILREEVAGFLRARCCPKPVPVQLINLSPDISFMPGRFWRLHFPCCFNDLSLSLLFDYQKHWIAFFPLHQTADQLKGGSSAMCTGPVAVWLLCDGGHFLLRFYPTPPSSSRVRDGVEKKSVCLAQAKSHKTTQYGEIFISESFLSTSVLLGQRAQLLGVYASSNKLYCVCRCVVLRCSVFTYASINTSSSVAHQRVCTPSGKGQITLRRTIALVSCVGFSQPATLDTLLAGEFERCMHFFLHCSCYRREKEKRIVDLNPFGYFRPKAHGDMVQRTNRLSGKCMNRGFFVIFVFFCWVF